MSGSNNSSVFSDFCQAWVARFPGSELPAAWEEDVRANLKKHKSKVSMLREELEKEEMYVEYLDKLLVDIETHRAKGTEVPEAAAAAQRDKAMNTENKRRSSEFKQQFLDDQLAGYKPNGSAKAEDDKVGAAKAANLHLKLDGDHNDESTFVTVINVSNGNKSGRGEGKPEKEIGSNLTFTKNKKVPPKPPPKRAVSRESLNSVSSPTTPTSPAIEEEFLPTREGLVTSGIVTKLSSSSGDDEDEEFVHRGRPDGIDNTQEDLTGAGANSNSAAPKAKIKELMANWENRPPIGAKPPVAESRKARLPSESDQSPKRDSIERVRMGSPSGKSRDSSDSETGWSRRAGELSPGTRRRVSGETRLDRLVRKPSGDPPAPALPKPMKKPKAKPRSLSREEPLYDTVANEEPEDEYDNHLLYGTNSTVKSDTVCSSGGGSSSADLGFDEPPLQSSSLLKSAQSGLSLTGSGTLSSSDTDGLSGSPSLKRGISFEEEESNYVNIQYFLQSQKSQYDRDGSRRSNNASLNALDTIQSDDDLDESEDKKVPKLPEPSPSSSSQQQQPTASDAERITMYKCILNSIVDSEAIYLEGLSVMLQYMKAMKVTLSTSQPVIPREEFDTIFYKIPELHDLHYTFHESLKKQVERWNGVDSIGHTFKMLASRTKIYKAFLGNYQQALDSLHRCTEAYPQFADLARSIKLRTVKGQRQGQSLSMEDLLHKPVAR